MTLTSSKGGEREGTAAIRVITVIRVIRVMRVIRVIRVEKLHTQPQYIYIIYI